MVPKIGCVLLFFFFFFFFFACWNGGNEEAKEKCCFEVYTVMSVLKTNWTWYEEDRSGDGSLFVLDHTEYYLLVVTREILLASAIWHCTHPSIDSAVLVVTTYSVVRGNRFSDASGTNMMIRAWTRLIASVPHTILNLAQSGLALRTFPAATTSNNQLTPTRYVLYYLTRIDFPFLA